MTLLTRWIKTHLGSSPEIKEKLREIDKEVAAAIEESADKVQLDLERDAKITTDMAATVVNIPSDDEIGEFDAYYVDGADATEIVPGGNLPPSVGISLPEKGMLHILGRPIIKTLFKNTILIGRTTIFANAEDDSRIEKVEFYIDGILKKTDTEEPYEYSFRKIKLLKRIFLRFHTITVKAYDDEGKTRTTSLNVITFFL